MMIKNLNHLRVVLAAAAAGVLLAVGMLVLVAEDPAEAAFPGQNGKIAFVSERDGNSEIYTMNANGTGSDRLTNNTADDNNPAWSPDGKKIAFVSTRAGNAEIYTMNAADGKCLVRLTNNPAGDYNPAWSPDGTKIAFSRGSEIYTMNSANGTGVVRFTNAPASIDYQPAWQRLSARPGSPPPINVPCNGGVAAPPNSGNAPPNSGNAPPG